MRGILGVLSLSRNVTHFVRVKDSQVNVSQEVARANCRITVTLTSSVKHLFLHDPADAEEKPAKFGQY